MLNMIWVQNKILILMERRVEFMAGKGVGGFSFIVKNGDGLLEVCGVPLERRALSRLLKIASRNGVLHRCLSMGQRMYIGLVVKLVDRVSSLLVARVLAPIIVRLLEALRGFPKLMMEVLGRVKYWIIVKGREKAEEISRIAQKWGNKTAHKWAKETGFIRFITIMYMPLWESQSIRQTYAN